MFNIIYCAVNIIIYYVCIRATLSGNILRHTEPSIEIKYYELAKGFLYMVTEVAGGGQRK